MTICYKNSLLLSLTHEEYMQIGSYPQFNHTFLVKTG